MIVSEAAKALGITTVSVYRLKERGTLKAISTDPIRFDPADIEAYRKQKEQEIPKDLILQEYRAGGITQAQLAAKYGCHVATISRVVRKGKDT